MPSTPTPMEACEVVVFVVVRNGTKQFWRLRHIQPAWQTQNMTRMLYDICVDACAITPDSWIVNRAFPAELSTKLHSSGA
jgi:hypothetical protein